MLRGDFGCVPSVTCCWQLHGGNMSAQEMAAAKEGLLLRCLALDHAAWQALNLLFKLHWECVWIGFGRIWQVSQVSLNIPYCIYIHYTFNYMNYILIYIYDIYINYIYTYIIHILYVYCTYIIIHWTQHRSPQWTVSATWKWLTEAGGLWGLQRTAGGSGRNGGGCGWAGAGKWYLRYINIYIFICLFIYVFVRFYIYIYIRIHIYWFT